MKYLRIPLSNWSDEELKQSLDHFSRGVLPDTSDPYQSIVDVMQEFSGRGLEMTWETFIGINETMDADPRWGMKPEG